MNLVSRENYLLLSGIDYFHRENIFPKQTPKIYPCVYLALPEFKKISTLLQGKLENVSYDEDLSTVLLLLS